MGDILSEAQPRRQPPNGYGQSMPIRQQTMVPDVSTGPIRRPLQNLNSIEDSLSKTIPSKKQPERQQPPVREEFKSPSEFSRFSHVSKKNSDKEPLIEVDLDPVDDVDALFEDKDATHREQTPSQKQEDWYEGQRLRDMGIKVEKKNETDGSIFYYPR